MENENAIEITRLVVQYSGQRVVDGLSFHVRRGEIFGFLGPNGAGKSTTLKSVLGLVFPSSGTIRLHGLPPSDPRSRLSVGFMPEEATYYRFLTPMEILRFYGRFYPVPSAEIKERARKLLDLVGLSSATRRVLGTFSKGMVQKVSLAQALMNDPETLILDEPTTGLDPLAKIELRDVLSELKRRGKTIFFSSHELSEAELLCDSVMILKSGRALRAGALKEVLATQGGHSLEKFFLNTIRGSA